jgi:hypothetical protein
MLISVHTYIDTCTNHKESVAQAEKQRTQVDVSERVKAWKLRENYHCKCHHCYELVQLQGPMGKKIRIQDLFDSPEREEKKIKWSLGITKRHKKKKNFGLKLHSFFLFSKGNHILDQN